MKRVALKNFVVNFVLSGVIAIAAAVGVNQAQAIEYKDKARDKSRDKPHEKYPETHGQAALDDIRVSGAWYAGGILSKYLGKISPSVTTKVLQNTETGVPLTAEKIDEVMGTIAKSPTANLTVGEYGGGELTIWLDADHLRRVQGTGNAGHLAEDMNKVAPNISRAAHELSGGGNVSAHRAVSVGSRQEGIQAFSQSVRVAEGFAPRFTPMTINVGKAGTQDTLKQLQDIMKSGARIQKISFRSLASRALIPNTLHGIGVASIFPAISHLGTAIYHAGKSAVNHLMSDNDAVCQPKTPCENPSFVEKATLSTAPLPPAVEKTIEAVIGK